MWGNLSVQLHLILYETSKNTDRLKNGKDPINTCEVDFSLSVKAATLSFISGRGSAISLAKEGKSGFIYNLLKN